ncbi:hypothetical protein ABZP36_011578 [Zizania latifolia]
MSQLVLRRLAARHCGYSCRRLSSSGAHYSGGVGRRGPYQERHEEEGRAVKVSVWWDFENCHLPNGVDAYRVAPRVTAAVRSAGIRGPLSITAFGDVIQIARSSQENLVATGVSISHVPQSGKNSSDRSFMADLVYWIAQNPPPAHFFLISGDKDFANILHRLRMSNYNILLACPDSATSVLCSAATIMWPWDALVKGEDFSPKRFNHPPDGLAGSWYGHYKGALDDPFLDSEPEELIAVPSDTKYCSIPKYVVYGIRDALKLFPNGVSLSELRKELKKRNIYLGKDFFGHKKLSCLLQSMPDIVEFINPLPGEDQPCVIGINRRLLDPAKQSFKSSSESNVRDNNLSLATNNDKPPPFPVSVSFPEKNAKTQNASQSIIRNRNFVQTVNENSPTFGISSSQSDVLSEVQKELPTADLNSQTESPEHHKEVYARTASGNPSSSGMENNASKDGLFKGIWLLWNGPETAKSEVSHLESISAVVVDGVQTPQQEHNADENQRLLKRIHKTSCGNGISDGTDSTTAGTDASTSFDDDCSKNLKHGDDMGLLNRDTLNVENTKPCDRQASVSMETAGKRDAISKIGKGLFSRVTGWIKFGKSDADNSTTNRNVIDEACTDSIEGSEYLKASTCGNVQLVVHEIFTKPYFWDVLQKQLSKPLGSELISKAKTREELGHQLQTLDCWPLKGLDEKDLHQLVNLLVSEKKWVEETPSRCFPFRLTLTHKRTCAPSNSSKFHGLSSLFHNGKSLQQVKCVGDKSTNGPLAREEILSDVGDKSTNEPLDREEILSDVGDKSTNRPLAREEILSDCHKLLKDLFLEYEHGFYMCIFKPRFVQKHGYVLDHKKLGYPNLQSLLQIFMPGIRVKFPRVLPAQNGNDQDGSKGNGNQSNGDDFVWEELGPVSATTETVEWVEKEMCYRPPTLSDDDFSDNENHADQQPRRETETSSFLQIIDSWRISKDVTSKKIQDIDGLVDCSRSDRCNLDNLIEGNAPKPTRSLHKQYSFVSDSEEEDNEKDKLVETVLGSLQKARGSKLHS